MEIRQLHTLLRVVQLRSFSKAAQELGYTQAAVTIQIKLLEKELGVQLLDRIGKHITLTTPGEEFLQHANNILKEVNDAQYALGRAEDMEHSLHIGTIESLCFAKLPLLLHYFHKNFPKVSLKITTGSPAQLINMMEHNEVDIIYFLDKPIYNNKWVKVQEEKKYIVFVASSKSPLVHRHSIKLAELLEYPFYLTEKEDNYRYSLDQFLTSQNMSITPFLEVGNTEFILKMVKDNMGLSFLPHFAVSESVEKGETVILPVTDFKMSMARQIFYHKDKWVTREMRECIRLVELGIL